MTEAPDTGSNTPGPSVKRPPAAPRPAETKSSGSPKPDRAKPAGPSTPASSTAPAAAAKGDNANAGAKADGGGGANSGNKSGKPRRRGNQNNRSAKPAKSDADGATSSANDGKRRESKSQENAPIGGDSRNPSELPEPSREGRVRVEDAEKALVRRPQIGDTRPSSSGDDGAAAAPSDAVTAASQKSKSQSQHSNAKGQGGQGGQGAPAKRRRRGGRGRSGKSKDAVNTGRAPVGVRSGVANPVTAMTGGEAVTVDEDIIEERRGRNRKGRPVGRYLMAVQVRPEATQIAVLEGRHLIEHYVARPADDVSQIHGNIYLGRVQNVLPGMEAAFIDIGTPKNAVLYRGDVHYDAEDIEEADNLRIEQLLKPRQTVVCQVTKNPIMHKGARLTQEVSLPGRFVVLVPNSRTLGISKRLPDSERKRLRNILDKCRPDGHGVIVRTAAENITGPEIERDLARLVTQWEKIASLAAKASAPALLYREPDMALRVIREEFNRDYRKIVIDDEEIYSDVHDYVASVSPALTERIVRYDTEAPLPLFEKYHVIEQLHRALDRKVWLPSGGSLIIEHTEALTVIDVNTGKNVGTSNLEDTVYKNNLEAAEEIARQLRLRDVGGIIVIDFIDMEIKANRAQVVKVFRDALARDKTRTQVFDISELGLVQMTRKRIGEGLLESFTETCATCEGRGVVFDQALLR